MTSPVVYLGDTAMSGAASYLAGVMTWAGIAFDYLPSDQSLDGQWFGTNRRLLILSDYAASQIATDLQRQIVQQVQQGMGLLMCGGWESYAGQAGHWAGTPIGDILPVEISRSDDRVNSDQPAVAVCVNDTHPITQGLPWHDRCPTIGGFNRALGAKTGAQTLLHLQRFDVMRQSGGEFRWTPIKPEPLLVVAQHGQGRTAALMSDVAPHWVGGLVDWTDGQTPRVTAQDKRHGGNEIEVGPMYAKFLQQLVCWTAAI